MENITIDPLAGLAAELPEATARDHAAALVKGGGVTLEAANASLASRGAAPLAANSREVAEASRAALLNDNAFTARYSQGDPEAIAKLFQADLRVQQSSGKLTDRAPQPTDPAYNGARAAVLHNVPPDLPADRALALADDFAGLLAALQLPEQSATALVEQHNAAVAETNPMSADEKAQWGQSQRSLLHQVIGADAEAKLKAASDTLGRTRGKVFDLDAIVHTNGAAAALTLYQNAETLAARRKG